MRERDGEGRELHCFSSWSETKQNLFIFEHDRGHLGIPQNDTQLNDTEKVNTEQNDSQQNDSYHNGLLRLIHSSAGRDSLYTD